MKIRLDEVQDVLQPGDVLTAAAYVHRCLSDVCQVKFIGPANAQYCSLRCGSRDRQRRFRARRNGVER